MQTFLDLRQEVLRRATRDQGGTQFDVAVKNIVNSSLFRVSREAPWRCMRRTGIVTTIADYVTGSNYGYATLTSGSNVVSITNGKLWTDQININRFINFSANSTYYTIKAIISNTQLVIDKPYQGVSVTNSNYAILPQSEYNLPIQAGHRMFIWHRDYGFPIKMNYLTDQTFYEISYFLTIKNIPVYYRMWGEDMVIKQVTTATNLSCVSSSTSDSTQKITIFGDVAGYPNSEIVSLNGTSAVTTSNLFSKVERVSKDSSSVGMITVTGNSGNTTVAVMPAGDTTAGILYKKIAIYPLPMRSFDLNVSYYKDPYRLVNDGDIHELGQEFDEAIILLSVSKIKGETEQAGAGSFFSMWQDEMRSLRRVNMDKMDWQPKLKRPNQQVTGLFVAPNLQFGQIGGSGAYGPSGR